MTIAASDGMDDPLTNLDAALDELCKALARVPDLAEMAQGCRAYEIALAAFPLESPGTVAALSVAPVWARLADVAEEVLRLRVASVDGKDLT